LLRFTKREDQDDAGLEWLSSTSNRDGWKDCTAESGYRKGLQHFERSRSKDEPPRLENPRLITLAVAITRRCDGCITVHTDAAIKQGASREEIAEALGVAVSVNAGAALVYSARVIDAYEVNTGSAVATK